MIDIKNQDFIHYRTLLEYKKNSGMNCSVFLSFLSELGEEFGKRFKDFQRNWKTFVIF